MGEDKMMENAEIRIFTDVDGFWTIDGKGSPYTRTRMLAVALAFMIWDCKEKGGDALKLLSKCFHDFAEAVDRMDKKSKEGKQNKTHLIDGVTECCGYDFGTDYKKASFCPECGKKIVKKEWLE